MLQVVVHGDDHFISCSSDPTQERVMLAVIAHEVDAAYPCKLALKLADDGPTLVGAAVIHQNEFVLPGERRQRLRKPLHKFGQDGFTSVNRYHDRNAGPSACVSRSHGFHLTSKSPASARLGKSRSSAVLRSSAIGPANGGRRFRTTRLMLCESMTARARWVRPDGSS